MTILAQLCLNESAELDFGLNISGAENKDRQIRFIIEGPDYGIICKCVEADGVITATVPKLEGILKSGTYSSLLEIVVDGKHFRPLTESIQFDNPVSVEVFRKNESLQRNTMQVESKDVVVRRPATSNVSVTTKPSRTVTTDSNQDDADRARYNRLMEMQQKLKSYESKLSNLKTNK